MRLVVTKKDRYIYSVLFDENNQPLEMAAENADTPSCLGNIYVGHVNNIVKNITSLEQAGYTDITAKTLLKGCYH